MFALSLKVASRIATKHLPPWASNNFKIYERRRHDGEKTIMLTVNFFWVHLADSARLYRQFSGKELAHADPHLISSDRIWIGHCKKFRHQAFYILILVIDKQPGLARQIIIFSLEWPLNILICIEFVRLKNDFFQIIFTPLPEVRCSC